MKFWNFQQGISPDQIELRIDGDIVDDGDAWIYEWFGIPVASPNAFRNDLAQYTGKNLSVWINSDGGSVFAATGIYNAIMQHKNTGGKVTTIIDSRAMSAAGIIVMAGDKRKITPGALFMMHDPLTKASGYASDLRKAADVLDVVKDNIINAYQLATGKDRQQISAMMEDETYMSARTALKEGFATEMLYVDQSENDDSILNFSFKRLDIQNAANQSMKSFFEIAKRVAEPAATTQNKEEKTVPINSIDDLKKENPGLFNQIVQDVLNGERTRISGLEALDNPSNKAIHEIVNDARLSGKTADDIKTVVEIINRNSATQMPAPDAPATPKPDNAAVAHPFAQIIADSAASGVNGVGARGDNPANNDKKELEDAANFMAGIINKKNGVTK